MDYNDRVRNGSSVEIEINYNYYPLLNEIGSNPRFREFDTDES